MLKMETLGTLDAFLLFREGMTFSAKPFKPKTAPQRLSATNRSVGRVLLGERGLCSMGARHSLNMALKSWAPLGIKQVSISPPGSRDGIQSFSAKDREVRGWYKLKWGCMNSDWGGATLHLDSGMAKMNSFGAFMPFWGNLCVSLWKPRIWTLWNMGCLVQALWHSSRY